MTRLLLGITLVSVCLVPVAHADPPLRPNVIVILTDDMRWDELENMPNVLALIRDRGLTFSNAFVSNSSCCPSRATILTGRYSDSTGVWNNTNHGGWDAFRVDEPFALPVWMHAAGYRTALIGKYLNGYTGKTVPPGWDRWVVFETKPDYYGYKLNIDGVISKQHKKAPRDYSTDVLGAQAVAFEQSAEPFFLYFAPFGPHAPHTPAPRHLGAPLTVGPLPANVNEANVSDKPAYIRALKVKPLSKWTDMKLAQERTLLSVDEWVGQIVAAAPADTVFLFMSDNGLELGSHRYTDKQVPYEEAIRVPMIWSGIGSGVDGRMVTNADVAPTIAAIAGATPNFPPQGFSLLSDETRDSFPLEHVVQSAKDDGQNPPTFCGVRTQSAMFTYYANGHEELYDLTADPLEMSNVAADAGYAELLDSLMALAREECVPTPPGLTWAPYPWGTVRAASKLRGRVTVF